MGWSEAGLRSSVSLKVLFRLTFCRAYWPWHRQFVICVLLYGWSVALMLQCFIAA